MKTHATVTYLSFVITLAINKHRLIFCTMKYRGKSLRLDLLRICCCTVLVYDFLQLLFMPVCFKQEAES